MRAFQLRMVAPLTYRFGRAEPSKLFCYRNVPEVLSLPLVYGSLSKFQCHATH